MGRNVVNNLQTISIYYEVTSVKNYNAFTRQTEQEVKLAKSDEHVKNSLNKITNELLKKLMGLTVQQSSQPRIPKTRS